MSVTVHPAFSDNGSDEFFHKTFRALGLQAYRGIMQKTPRRTGRAAGNWQISINQTTDAESDKKLPVQGSMSSQEMGKLSKTKVVKYPTIYIQNALPYIQRLEFDAWSQQHPAGMVRVTLAELALQSN